MLKKSTRVSCNVNAPLHVHITSWTTKIIRGWNVYVISVRVYVICNTKSSLHHRVWLPSTPHSLAFPHYWHTHALSHVTSVRSKPVLVDGLSFSGRGTEKSSAVGASIVTVWKLTQSYRQKSARSRPYGKAYVICNTKGVSCMKCICNMNWIRNMVNTILKGQFDRHLSQQFQEKLNLVGERERAARRHAQRRAHRVLRVELFSPC